MNSHRAAVAGVLLLASTAALSAAFTDPIRVVSESQAEGRSIAFVISPPSLLSSTEASWPTCSSITIIVPENPQVRGVTPKDHVAALKRLREAMRDKQPVYFGPAGKGLIASRNDRCRLNSKGLTIVQRSDGKVAIISFHDE